MRKQTLIAVSMLLGSTMASAESTPSTSTAAPATSTAPASAPASAPAAAPASAPTADSADEMSKTAWLDTIVPMLPSLICKGFMGDPELKQRLDTIKMDYDQCVKVMPESVTKCQTQLSPNIPDKITSADASTWGKSLGECIGKDFAMKYLIPKS